MKFSIISPCYNAAYQLSTMIESVLSQDYSNFELIMVNDGSSDNTKEIITSYQQSDSRIVLVDQENSGKPSIARNNAIKISTGEIICFLDADDTMLQGKLSKVADVFKADINTNFVVHDFLTLDQNNMLSDKGVVESHWQERNMDNAFIKQNGKLQSIPDVYQYFLTEWVFLHVNTVALRKSAFNISDILFDEKLLFAEDISKWCELSVIFPFIYINQALATYRDTPNSLMKDGLKADIAAVDFISQHLHKPLVEVNEKTKQKLCIKLSTEIRNVLHLLAIGKKLASYCYYAKKLLQHQCSLSNIFYIIKNLFNFLRPKNELK